MDETYDPLVHLRDGMGKKLGYEGYTTLGYYRMQRNCYTKADIEKFRAAVVEYLVPVADRICRAQAERLGVAYPMSYADEALMFRSGNPRPAGDADAILAMGKKFYDELSPETSEFFNTMLDGKLLDVLSTPGKESGGYCTSIPDYNVPFIFANFNGTQGDVEVVTHEAGHAFAAWTNRDRVPMQYTWPTMEACEVHSMSMEFFAWPWAEGFFGADARKFRYSHLAAALTFIPYGTAVDHFQHIAYEKPDLTPAQRHAVWKELLGTYMPWLRLDGDIPFYGDGESWQQKHHIYSSPFYYIDYCLAQTVSLEFWAMIQKDPKDAWQHYMAYTRQGGTKVFTELLANAGMVSPFEPDCLRTVCEAASRWLDEFDLTGIRYAGRPPRRRKAGPFLTAAPGGEYYGIWGKQRARAAFARTAKPRERMTRHAYPILLRPGRPALPAAVGRLPGRRRTCRCAAAGGPACRHGRSRRAAVRPGGHCARNHRHAGKRPALHRRRADPGAGRLPGLRGGLGRRQPENRHRRRRAGALPCLLRRQRSRPDRLRRALARRPGRRGAGAAGAELARRPRDRP